MFSLIGSIIKYSLLVITILVLSHIIEIDGVTVSNHVLNGMHFFSHHSPHLSDIEKPIKKIESQHFNKSEIGAAADERALQEVIKHSEKK